jgi:hypothetical protein
LPSTRKITLFEWWWENGGIHKFWISLKLDKKYSRKFPRLR